MNSKPWTMVLDWKTHSCLGYTLIILFVGFPVWWATTTGREKKNSSTIFISQGVQ